MKKKKYRYLKPQKLSFEQLVTEVVDGGLDSYSALDAQLAENSVLVYSQYACFGGGGAQPYGCGNWNTFPLPCPTEFC